MNHYIDAQCKNMMAMVSTFEHACKIAAAQDDGAVSKEEQKQLQKINAAAEKFKAELQRITAP